VLVGAGRAREFFVFRLRKLGVHGFSPAENKSTVREHEGLGLEPGCVGKDLRGKTIGLTDREGRAAFRF
jgi:hypothetical protein